MFTKEDKVIARALVNDEMIALIEKILEQPYALEIELEKNVVALSDERYGQMMKVNFIARQHLKSCITRIKQLSKDENSGDKVRPAAPK